MARPVFLRVSRFSVRRSSPNFIRPLTRELNISSWFTKPRTSVAISCSGKLSRSVDCRRPRQLFRPPAAGAKTIPSSSARFSNNTAAPREQERRWRVAGLAGPVTLGQRLSRRIFPRLRRDQLRTCTCSFTCCVACSAMPCSTILKPPSVPKSAPESRRALLPALRKIGNAMPEKHQHRELIPSFEEELRAHFGTSIVTNFNWFLEG